MTYETNRALLKEAAAKLELSPQDANALHWAHEIAMRTDPETGSITYEGGHADFASWMKATSEDRAYLVGKRESVTATPSTSGISPDTVSGIMYAAKTDPAAMAALRSKLGLI